MVDMTTPYPSLCMHTVAQVKHASIWYVQVSQLNMEMRAGLETVHRFDCAEAYAPSLSHDMRAHDTRMRTHDTCMRTHISQHVHVSAGQLHARSTPCPPSTYTCLLPSTHVPASANCCLHIRQSTTHPYIVLHKHVPRTPLPRL